MIRAADNLFALEKKINDALDCPEMALDWEHWLRTRKTKRYPHLAVIALYFGVVYASPLIGVVISGNLSIPQVLLRILLPWGIALIPMAHIYYLSSQFYCQVDKKKKKTFSGRKLTKQLKNTENESLSSVQ